jgi:hypothetical protein
LTTSSTSAAVLDVLTARCDQLHVAHSGIQHTPAGPRLDIPDPDGTVLRFYRFTDSTTFPRANPPVREYCGARRVSSVAGSSIGPGAEAPRQGGDHHRRRDEV